MQLKFSDDGGTTLDVLAVNGGSVYFQGASRDSLEIQVAKDRIAFDVLDALSAEPGNLETLSLTDGGRQYVHNGYVLRRELALKPIVTAAATDAAPERAEDRLCLTLCRRTYLETRQQTQQAEIDALTLAALGVK